MTRRSSRLLNKKAQLSKANNNCSSDNHLCSNNESSCLKTPLQKTVDNIDKKTSKKLTKIKVAPPLLLLPPPPPPPLPSFQHHLKSLEEIKLYRQGCAHQVSTMVNFMVSYNPLIFYSYFIFIAGFVVFITNITFVITYVFMSFCYAYQFL